MDRLRSNYIVFPLLVSILLYGCTFTYKKPDSDKVDDFYSRVNLYGERYRSIISLNDSSTIEAQSVHVKVDSTSYILASSDNRMKIATSNIQSIEFSDPAVGAIGGMTMGLLCGVGLAISAIYLSADENSGDANFGPMLALIYGTLIGAVSGLIIGVIREDRKVFILNP